MNDQTRVDNSDSHGTATGTDLPWIWQEMSEFLWKNMEKGSYPSAT